MEYVQADDDATVQRFMASLARILTGNATPSDHSVALPKSINGVRTFDATTGDNMGLVITLDPDEPITALMVAAWTPWTWSGLTNLPVTDAGYLDLALLGRN